MNHDLECGPIILLDKTVGKFLMFVPKIFPSITKLSRKKLTSIYLQLCNMDTEAKNKRGRAGRKPKDLDIETSIIEYIKCKENNYGRN